MATSGILLFIVHPLPVLVVFGLVGLEVAVAIIQAFVFKGYELVNTIFSVRNNYEITINNSLHAGVPVLLNLLASHPTRYSHEFPLWSV